MELPDSDGRIGGRIADSTMDKNCTRRPTESTNLNPWVSQSLSHQTKNIHGLDLGLSAHMEQMCRLVFMWAMNSWDRAYTKSSCLYIGYILLAGLPCLDSVEEEVTSLAKI